MARGRKTASWSKCRFRWMLTRVFVRLRLRNFPYWPHRETTTLDYVLFEGDPYVSPFDMSDIVQTVNDTEDTARQLVRLGALDAGTFEVFDRRVGMLGRWARSRIDVQYVRHLRGVRTKRVLLRHRARVLEERKSFYADRAQVLEEKMP